MKLGIKVAGFEAFDPKASSYEALASKIKDKDASGVFVGGLICENGGKLIKDLRSALGPSVKLILPDGFTPISAVVQDAGAAAEAHSSASPGVPNSQLKGQGKAFLAAFTKVNHRESPDPYSVDAAQATVVLLSAIAKSNGTRAGVASRALQGQSQEQHPGQHLVQQRRATSQGGPVAIYRVKGGKSTDYTVIRPPAALVKAA